MPKEKKENAWTCMYICTSTYLIDNAGRMSDRKLDMHSMHCSIFFSEKLMDRLQKVGLIIFVVV